MQTSDSTRSATKQELSRRHSHARNQPIIHSLWPQTVPQGSDKTQIVAPNHSTGVMVGGRGRQPTRRKGYQNRSRHACKIGTKLVAFRKKQQCQAHQNENIPNLMRISVCRCHGGFGHEDRCMGRYSVIPVALYRRIHTMRLRLHVKSTDRIGCRFSAHVDIRQWFRWLLWNHT